MGYAAAHPDRVAALILVGSAGPSLRTQDTVSQRLNARLTQSDRDSIAYWSRLVANVSTHAEALAKVGYFTRRAYIYDRRNEAAVEQSREADSVNPVVSRLTIQDLRKTNFDLAPALSSIHEKFPVLVMYGAADAIGGTTAPEILKALPQAHVRVIRRSGHYPWIEAPTEFYPQIRSFLGTVEQRTGR
jgi:proline iminopeptidase